MAETKRRPSPVADSKLLAQALKDAEQWMERVKAGLTAKDRSRPVMAEDRGGAEIPVSALPFEVRAAVESDVWGGGDD